MELAENLSLPDDLACLLLPRLMPSVEKLGFWG